MPPPFGRPIDSSTPYCDLASHKSEDMSYDFSLGESVHVVQSNHDERPWKGAVSVLTSGEIRVRRLPRETGAGRARFTVKAFVSDPSIKLLKIWKENSGSLEISTPRYADVSNHQQRHCISLEITAWLPEETVLADTLSVEAVTLGLRVFEDINVNVRHSKFVTVTGNVWFPVVNGSQVRTVDSSDIQPSLNDLKSSSWLSTGDLAYPFSSRYLHIETVTGNIKGCYPLLDLLGITSQAGSISVNVIPRPILPSLPSPASLDIKTSAGTIDVKLPLSSRSNPEFIPPPRNYITKVHSEAGRISGSFYLGSESEFRSTAGGIRISVLPVLETGSEDRSNIFDTHTTSGTTEIEVLDPMFITLLKSEPYPPIGDQDPYLLPPMSPDVATEKEAKLRSLASKHDSTSSSVRVMYPKSWEGTLKAETLTGYIEARGEGVRIVRQKKGWAGNEVVARKGVDDDDEGCLVEMSAISGMLDFAVGN